MVKEVEHIIECKKGNKVWTGSFISIAYVYCVLASVLMCDDFTKWDGCVYSNSCLENLKQYKTVVGIGPQLFNFLL